MKLFLILVCILIYSCSSEIKNTKINSNKAIINKPAVFSILLDEDFFNMILIKDSYISETELKQELWHTVLTWARKYKAYEFSKYSSDYNFNPNLPINNISWRDALLFTNALTEWYNEHNTKNEVLSLVYYSDKEYQLPIRKVSSSEQIDLKKGSYDNPYIDENADGFRLLYFKEWLYIINQNKDKLYNLSTASLYAWFQYNSSYQFHEVKTLNSDNLALYDIFGNLSEFLYDWHPDYYGLEKLVVGGSFISLLDDLNTFSFIAPYTSLDNIGFRIAKNK